MISATSRDDLAGASVMPHGASWPTPYSFSHSFVRYAGEQKMTIRQTHWDIDSEGRGVAAYRADLAGRPFSWVVASHMLGPESHQDRIIATQWDATSTLVDGEAAEIDFMSVYGELPNVLWGRATRNTLVWSRANRSVRLFAHTAESLSRGKQPDPERVAAIGYLFRTTGFSANGRNGMVDYAALVEQRHPLRGTYHAQMLAAYLWREFSVNLVEHMARQLQPEAAKLSPELHRYLGVGNSSGIGLAPFVVRHPILIDHWSTRSERALDAAVGLPLDMPWTEDRSLGSELHDRLDGAVQHFREQPTGDFEHFTAGPAIASDLRTAQRLLANLTHSDRTVGELLGDLREHITTEAHEAVKSVILETTVLGSESDRLDDMTADETLYFDGSMQCGVLRGLLRTHFGWALDQPVSSRSTDYYFWYYSEEHAEPRRGDPGEDPGEEYSIPLDVMGRLQQLGEALADMDSQLPIAELAMLQPDLHYTISWVQTMASRPNAFVPTDFLSRDFLPLDVMRFQLAMYGMLKMRPTSRNWLRGTILQGAPLPEELSTRSMPIFPVVPSLAGGTP